MILQSAFRRGGRRRWLVGLVGVGLAVAVIAYALGSAGRGSASTSAGLRTARPEVFRMAMIARLRAENLDYHWVVCIRSGNRFRGVPIVRCNVDFGEPHVVAYCSVLRAGRLLTSQEDPAIPCGHDNAGYSASVVTYG